MQMMKKDYLGRLHHIFATEKWGMNMAQQKKSFMKKTTSNIKLSFMKLMVKRGRNKLLKRLAKLPTKGEKFMVQRVDAAPVTTYLYRPKFGNGTLPVVFNVHGGAWVGGDALLLDTQSQEMADRLGAMVVNINYIKADVKPFPYAQYEIRDTVQYFAEHAAEYGIDTQKLALMGYSAGGHLCACAAQLLKEANIAISCQVLCYPFLDFTFVQDKNNEFKESIDPDGDLGQVFFPGLDKTDPLVSPGVLPEDKLQGLAPAIIITCGGDPLKPQADAYKLRLEKADVPVTLFDYPKSVHGFLECNFPETEDTNAAKSPEQAVQCRVAEQAIANELRKIWN